jgi:hypothetical protein
MAGLAAVVSSRGTVRLRESWQQKAIRKREFEVSFVVRIVARESRNYEWIWGGNSILAPSV